jgi:hypothetical protein
MIFEIIAVPGVSAHKNSDSNGQEKADHRNGNTIPPTKPLTQISHPISPAVIYYQSFLIPLSSQYEAKKSTMNERALLNRTEPRRVCRRLQLLRRWSLYEQDDEQICA